jgi:hypothetical protein
MPKSLMLGRVGFESKFINVHVLALLLDELPAMCLKKSTVSAILQYGGDLDSAISIFTNFNCVCTCLYGDANRSMSGHDRSQNMTNHAYKAYAFNKQG